MPKTKIVTKEYKESLSITTKRILGSKVTIAAIVLIILGVSLVEVSYNYHQTFITPSNTHYAKTIDTNATHTFSFVQPRNLSEHVYFTIPGSFSVSYKLVKYTQFTSPATGETHNEYSVVQTGNATNNTVLSIAQLERGVSQEYLLNLTSHEPSTFTVHVVAQYNITVTKDAALKLGLPGFLITIAGIILLAYSVTLAFESRQKR